MADGNIPREQDESACVEANHTACGFDHVFGIGIGIDTR